LLANLNCQKLKCWYFAKFLQKFLIMLKYWAFFALVLRNQYLYIQITVIWMENEISITIWFTKIQSTDTGTFWEGCALVNYLYGLLVLRMWKIFVIERIGNFTVTFQLKKWYHPFLYIKISKAREENFDFFSHVKLTHILMWPWNLENINIWYDDMNVEELNGYCSVLKPF
jgi:hypothetical protein